MNTNVTQEQIDAYQRDGYVILPDFLSEVEVDEILAAVEESVAQMGKQKVAGGNKDLVEGESYYDRVFLQRLNLWKLNDTIKKYFLGPKMGEMLCKLAGIDGIRVWHDQTLQKQPWGNPTAWHLDNPYWSFHSKNALSIWIALDEATVQNGCLYYLPGTHKTASYDNVDIREDIASLFDVYPQWKKIEPAVAAMKRGWAGVHNGLTAHGAGPNMTPFPRRAMTCAYMPEGEHFNGQQNILPKDYFDTLKIGDELNSEEHNPLIWSSK
ncbi:MAG: phytanoyl-CoA dioxygenase family protein [Deferribacteres bacterium]|nr:phytanoyl-CoA dioxygenase family protein [candidate division KSB1 bacterium]MCB9510752.1 phytanoyl-CoA dioxygenase family protein [Deferribacteres bacterium]